MIKTCNNCDIKSCKGMMNAVRGCVKHMHVPFKVPMRMLVSKVSVKEGPSSAAILPLLTKY